MQDSGFRVSNTMGAACTRCVQMMISCDKRGGGGLNDPCSECRWFGGLSCECVLATNTSYSDELWKQMLAREPFDYALPSATSREAPLGEERVAPSPMPDNKVKHGWEGESREELLRKPDMLPSYVRGLPRAYLHWPTYTYQDGNPKSHKRGREADTTSPSPTMTTAAFQTLSALPLTQPPPTFVRPPPHPQHGEVEISSWSWTKNQWDHTYQNGTRVVDLSQITSAPGPRSNTDMSAPINSLFNDMSLIEHHDNVDHRQFGMDRGVDTDAPNVSRQADNEQPTKKQSLRHDVPPTMSAASNQLRSFIQAKRESQTEMHEQPGSDDEELGYIDMSLSPRAASIDSIDYQSDE